LKKIGAEKLKPHLYGLERVIERVGEVSYELKMSKGERFTMYFMCHALKI
jgi:hypothetical protein